MEPLAKIGGKGEGVEQSTLVGVDTRGVVVGMKIAALNRGLQSSEAAPCRRLREHIAIAGLLAGKKYVPESAGTLKTDTVTFGVMTFAVIFIVAALSFFPAHALSTIAEHFSL